MGKNKSICIIAFSHIYRDARVLRQIKYLSPHFDLRIIGYGPPDPFWMNRPNIQWNGIGSIGNSQVRKGSLAKLSKFTQPFISRCKAAIGTQWMRVVVRRLKTYGSYLLMTMAKICPPFYDLWFWRKREHREAFQYAIQSPCDAFLANDWEALPMAAMAAEKYGSKLVFDAHEYAPLELGNHKVWRIFFQPAIEYFLRKHARQVNASVTVAPLIADRYQKEFGLDPIVLFNTPEPTTALSKELDFENIQLIHHGGAIRDRRLETMIETLIWCDRRFSLHFMLISNDMDYLNQLKILAERIVPGRVLFHEPVLPQDIVRRISEYDIGFYLLEPNNYNNEMALPNKFFDFVAAGLAVCVGPSPSMANMVQEYGFGCVTPSFNPREVAEVLNHLTEDQIRAMRSASRRASGKIHAEAEMEKLLKLFGRLFESNQTGVR